MRTHTQGQTAHSGPRNLHSAPGLHEQWEEATGQGGHSLGTAQQPWGWPADAAPSKVTFSATCPFSICSDTMTFSCVAPAKLCCLHFLT